MIFGYYSQTQELRTGYFSAIKVENGHQVSLTELYDAETRAVRRTAREPLRGSRDEALNYFHTEYKMRNPDGKFIGEVKEVVRVKQPKFPGKTAVIRTNIMGKRVNYTPAPTLKDFLK